MEKAQKELIKKERLATLGELTRIVSHEIRNPLGTLKNSLHVLKNALEVNDTNTITKVVNRSERSVERCNNIIKELSSFANQRDLILQEL